MSNKLLLADDSITIQKVVGIIFANEDYELTVVDNGDAALERAKQIVPDIILVDALMPGKNGYEVCAGVRQDPKLAGIPLLLMTGAFEPFDEDKARQSGADDFISKPFESQQLIDRVKKLIDLGKARIGAPSAVPTTGAEMPAEVLSATAPTKPVAPEFNQAFAAEPVVSEPAEEVFALDETAVEGSIDDDLWGAFDLEEVSGTGDFGVVADAASVAPPVTPQVDDSFSFAVVNEDVTDVSTSEKQPVEQQLESDWEPVEEEAFALEDEDQAEMGQPVELGFEEESTELGSAHEVVEPVFEAVSPFEENFEVEEVSAAVSAQESTTGFTAPVAGPDVGSTDTSEASTGAAISHAQLVAALSSLSRDVIEKIVWEVVPDLAEVLIKEEIRKLKGSTGH